MHIVCTSRWSALSHLFPAIAIRMSGGPYLVNSLIQFFKAWNELWNSTDTNSTLWVHPVFFYHNGRRPACTLSCLISTKLIPTKRRKVPTVMIKLVSYYPKNWKSEQVPKYHSKCRVLLENTPLQCEIHRNLHQGPKDPSLFYTAVCENCQMKWKVID